jgi:hypothetical protein
MTLRLESVEEEAREGRRKRSSKFEESLMAENMGLTKKA